MIFHSVFLFGKDKIMSVYVDPLFNTEGWSDKWPYPEACHMMADTDEELHEMAAKLKLRRSWHQSCPPHSVSHYDLTRNKRYHAIRLGAIEVDNRFRPDKISFKGIPVHICHMAPKDKPYLVSPNTKNCPFCGHSL